MATVRIYKVAELLGTTGQEVIALLKRDHGIEVKSASSTIEEVVARRFVERLARQRNIALPGGDMFAETPVGKGKKPAPPRKAAEPAKPTAPLLPPPRLVKAVKPAAAPVLESDEVAEEELVAPTAEATAPGPQVEAAESEAPAEAPAAEGIETAGFGAPHTEPPIAPSPGAQGVPNLSKPSAGRVVPPTLRLRIEEQRPTTPTPPLPTSAAPRLAPRPRCP